MKLYTSRFIEYRMFILNVYGISLMKHIFIHFRYDEQKKDSVMSSSDISPTIIQKSWTLIFDVIKRASLVYVSCHKLFVDCAVTVLIVYCAVTVLIVYLLTFVYIHSCFFQILLIIYFFKMSTTFLVIPFITNFMY